MVLFIYWLLPHLNLFIDLLSLNWYCCFGPLIFILGLLSTSYLFSLLICVVILLPLSLSVTNFITLDLLSCRGGASSAVLFITLSFSKLNLFLVSLNLFSCFLYSFFLYVFLMVSCGPLVIFFLHLFPELGENILSQRFLTIRVFFVLAFLFVFSHSLSLYGFFSFFVYLCSYCICFFSSLG